MGVFLKHFTSCLGMRVKPCHVFLHHYLSLYSQWHSCYMPLVQPRPLAWVRSRLVIVISVQNSNTYAQHYTNYMDGSRFSSQGCCVSVVWKRCRDGALPICWLLLSCIIPTLFPYFLACHPYIFIFLFLYFFYVNLKIDVNLSYS